MFNSLNNKPEDVRRAVEETAKLAAKLKAKKEKVTIVEECGECYGCVTMRKKCINEIDNAVYDDDGIYMYTKETV